MGMIRVSEETHAYLKQIALEEGVSMGEMVAFWVHQYIDEYTSPPRTVVEKVAPPRQEWSEARRRRHADIMQMVALRKKLQQSTALKTQGGQP